MPKGHAAVVMPALNSVTTPCGVIRPIRLPTVSVNHSAPSGPRVMREGSLCSWGSGYSVIAPVLPGIAEESGASAAVMGALAATFPLTMLAGLAASAKGEIPATSPRGGLRWSPRYLVRRSLWHIVDHTWEIEQRLEQE